MTPKIKPVKAWGIMYANGTLCALAVSIRALAKFNADAIAPTTKVVRVEIRVLPKRKKVSR